MEENKEVIDYNDTLNLLTFLHKFPNGVLKMSENIEGLVETSINLGVIKTIRESGTFQIKIQGLPRSSVNSSLKNLLNEITDLTRNHEANMKIDSSYTSWEYREDSKIRK